MFVSACVLLISTKQRRLSVRAPFADGRLPTQEDLCKSMHEKDQYYTGKTLLFNPTLLHTHSNSQCHIEAQSRVSSIFLNLIGVRNHQIKATLC